ncbi:RagB/SusD family nutrient uptake outer membrane protein [Subsaximicrobium wynnwilliamsii]|uniref:RagB/SusD family nutrient uptake outer membrane protein n=1 Tax=Subsaximicrobium wynnwilliamsii TaxID=291179 RepID=A0A5C6ZEQ9_9FLAO|nr:RagB/SusD family nutrient uptake outer membrane protein [Subsaximicrobium wynnwilliamsii]TXD81981.1 RagB/SusD family nutrient uptake outer membrane protein [Subsaximicrobium wynnwilliamsii]TXD87679.1 RagB/SusD family nutrient uptake outer membrane protein [Subsaximicrobium wynnwilliamsii]TXE01425.1 RagB/SusD family nutrient uptake outer membrane protein [Subsaximicrobium wynnwilliamsii]
MKNVKLLFQPLVLLLASSMLLVTCSDKLEENDGQLAADDLDYTNMNDMVLPLYGAYSATYTRGWEDPLLLGVRGDDVNAGGLDDQPLFAETDLYNYDKTFWMFNQVWNNFYSDLAVIINTAEIVERYKEFATGNNIARADQYIAETKVLSAYQHLNMARLWGNIFIIESTRFDEEVSNGVDTKEEVMQYVSDLMDEAIPFLPDVRPNERTDIPGGVTKYTALALKAMANQELENYQEVANATGQIINSSKFMLFNDFYELFKKPGKLSNESLFELQFSDFNQASGATENHLYAPFGPSNWTPVVEGASNGWGFYEPSLKYIKFMLDRGETVRLETSVLFTPDGIAEIQSDPAYTNLPNLVSNTTPDGDVINNYVRANFASGKHYLPSNQLTEGRNAYGSGKNFLVIRYSEILLMYAEARTRGASGTGMSADEAVNMVRSRANMPALSGVTTAQVLNEKFAELAMEWGIRYFDMIRVNDYSELSYEGRTFSADKELLPYPQAQLDLLPLGSNN